MSVLLFSWLIRTKNFQFSNFLHTFYIKNKEKWRKKYEFNRGKKKKIIGRP